MAEVSFTLFSHENLLIQYFTYKELNHKASFLQFTHPFATPEIINFFAYNLHVLSMLQAFILSQDQTHFSYRKNYINIILFYQTSLCFLKKLSYNILHIYEATHTYVSTNTCVGSYVDVTLPKRNLEPIL